MWLKKDSETKAFGYNSRVHKKVQVSILVHK